jgi:uncharacterized protein YndB with AHSA1/START domain
MQADLARVFDVISDPWLIPVWVVGATHIRDVDSEWPSPGSRLHHKVGAWPLALSDSTAVVDYEPPRRLVLQGRAYPFGEVRIELTVSAAANGSLVRMGETPTHGVAYALDNPVQRRILRARNRESLDRLAAIAEHRG